MGKYLEQLKLYYGVNDMNATSETKQGYKLSHAQYYKLCQYLERRAGEAREIGEFPSKISADSSLALDFPVSSSTIRSATEDLGITVRKKGDNSANGKAITNKQNIELIATRLQSIETKLDRLLTDCGISTK